LEEIETDARLCAGSRQVTSWRPILDYRLEDVWDSIKASGHHRHIAYDLGNERLSCALCVLATDRDIRNGAVHCPELRDRYLKIEAETGHTFKNKKRLSEIIAGERIQNPRLPGF
jgi:3'-phosphoadenosine 5'-phosphosulfate sulfotransferase (PAPS reductase)/FAD synthetase